MQYPHEYTCVFSVSIIENEFIRQPSFQAEWWVVWLGGMKIQDKVGYHIKDWVARKYLREYYYKRGLIAWTVFAHIDCTPLGDYLSIQTQTLKLWITKHWSNFCGIGVKLKNMRLWDVPVVRKHLNAAPFIYTFVTTQSSLPQENWVSNKYWIGLKKVNTDPLLLGLITTFWHGQSPCLELNYSSVYW